MKTIGPFPNSRSQSALRRAWPLAAFLGLLSGCSMLSYSGPSGERFSRVSFGSKTAIASLQVDADTNGVRKVALQGYQNDANQTVSAVTEAAVRAALGGALVKP